MSLTEGKWEQETPQSDLNLWLGADEFVDFAAVTTLPAAPVAGLIYKVVPATTAAKLFKSPESLMLRSGVFASAALDQQQFGTASGPGPSSVAGTSGPLAQPAGYPPFPASQLSTLGGGGIVRGPLPKGFQINSVDVVYQVLAAAATVATIGITKTFFANLVVPVVTNILTLGANGLPVVIGAQPQVTSISIPTPAMIVPAAGGDTAVTINVNFTAGAAGTVNFYGVMLKCSYNFN